MKERLIAVRQNYVEPQLEAALPDEVALVRGMLQTSQGKRLTAVQVLQSGQYKRWRNKVVEKLSDCQK